MDIHIHVEKKHVFMVLAGIVLAVSLVFVNAQNPAVFGHTPDQIDWTQPITELTVSGPVTLQNTVSSGPLTVLGPLDVNGNFDANSIDVSFVTTGGLDATGLIYTTNQVSAPQFDLTGTGDYRIRGETNEWYAIRTVRSSGAQCSSVCSNAFPGYAGGNCIGSSRVDGADSSTCSTTLVAQDCLCYGRVG